MILDIYKRQCVDTVTDYMCVYFHIHDMKDKPMTEFQTKKRNLVVFSCILQQIRIANCCHLYQSCSIAQHTRLRKQNTNNHHSLVIIANRTAKPLYMI